MSKEVGKDRHWFVIGVVYAIPHKLDANSSAQLYITLSHNVV